MENDNAIRLGEFFILKEFFVTSTGLKNEPIDLEREAVIDNLTGLVLEVLDPLRRIVGSISITSGFRSPEVNAAVRGAAQSFHLVGLAADFKATHLGAAELVRVIIEAGLRYDQVIWYHQRKGGHVHLQINGQGREWDRRQIMYCDETGVMHLLRVAFEPGASKRYGK